MNFYPSRQPPRFVPCTPTSIGAHRPFMNRGRQQFRPPPHFGYRHRYPHPPPPPPPQQPQAHSQDHPLPQPQNQTQQPHPPPPQPPQAQPPRQARLFNPYQSDTSVATVVHSHPPNAIANLSVAIRSLYLNSHQNSEQFLAKRNFWQKLTEVIEDVLPNCIVHMVGSTVNGFGVIHSDLDLCLVVKRKNGDNPDDEYFLLNKMKSIIQEIESVSEPSTIFAIVPILHFGVNDEFFVDLNVNHTVSVLNTNLLHAYSLIDERVRELVITVKIWAKRNGINSARTRTLSSYSLVLMCIMYLQHAVTPPILPNLLVDNPSKFNKLNGPDKITAQCDVTTTTNTHSDNHQLVGELFTGFLEYYAKFEFDQLCVSVRQGRPLFLWGHTPKNAYIYIEEPFRCGNTAAAVFDWSTFQKIKGVFINSSATLNKTMELDSIIPAQSPSETSYD